MMAMTYWHFTQRSSEPAASAAAEVAKEAAAVPSAMEQLVSHVLVSLRDTDMSARNNQVDEEAGADRKLILKEKQHAACLDLLE